MSEPVVLVERENGMATVTMNRPERLNAFNVEMRMSFCRAIRELRADPEIGCIIITGAGRAFSAGLDLKEFNAPRVDGDDDVSFITVVAEAEIPVIGAINGFAITGGLELALACDILIAAENAQFADTHARVGVMPGGGMSARLPRAVGIRKAKEMSFTGNYLCAADAERYGLVNHMVPKEKLMDAARELAGQILSSDRTVVRQMKQVYELATRKTMGEGLTIEQEFFRNFNRNRKAGDMEARRKTVMERGRSQSSTPRRS